MKHVLSSFVFLFLWACGSQVVEKESQTALIVQEGLSTSMAEESQGYHFYITGDLIQDGVGVLYDTISPVNYLELLGGALIAKLYWDSDSVQFLAITQRYAKGPCNYYRSDLVYMKENSKYQNVTDNYFPALDVYSFYDFEDAQLKQFEGDEQTVFSGYRFDFITDDALGIQFMFCNQQDPKNTQSLNGAGKTLYIPFGK
jgi:hypothetical protein